MTVGTVIVIQPSGERWECVEVGSMRGEEDALFYTADSQHAALEETKRRYSLVGLHVTEHGKRLYIHSPTVTLEWDCDDRLIR